MQKDLGAEIPQSQDDSVKEDPAIAGALIEHELDATNPTEQRTRAILQLFRSLAIGKTIAVVGSGASMIYGYPDWGGLIGELCREIKNKSKYKSKKGAEEKLDQLRKTLDDNSDHIDEKKKNKDKLPVPPAYHDPVLNNDEMLTICDEAASCLDPDSKRRFEIFMASLFERGKRYHKVKNILHNHPLKEDIEKFLKSLPISDRGKLTGDRLDHEALLPADVASLILSLPVKYEHKSDSKILNKNELVKAPRNLLDPLSKLRSKIGIHRFVTFNYDLEIEALLEDIDYPFDSLTRTPALGVYAADDDLGKPDRFTESRLGGSASSISLSAENAPDLITIAAIPSSANDLIVHVHGAITRPRDMVVTQSSYNAIYYDDHEFRRGFEDARRLLFGGNSILYIGLGLNEEDLMRPLRYLSANLRNRPLFALMPLLSNENRAQAFEHRIKSNFGVNVITYGRRYKDIPRVWMENEEGDKSHPRMEIGSDDFLSLGDELKNIRNEFHFSTDQSDRQVRLISALDKVIGEKKRFPRLHSGRAKVTELAKILINHQNLIDTDKTGQFVERLQTIAITVALCDALKYMQNVSCGWQRRLEIIKEAAVDGEALARGHYGAVHQKQLAGCSIFIDDQSNFEKFLRLLDPDSNPSSATILRVDSGAGRGSLFHFMKSKCEQKNSDGSCRKWRAINIGHTIREKMVLSEVLSNLGETEFLCLHDADYFLDDNEPRPATLFLGSFLNAVMAATMNQKSGHGLRLMLIARTARAADYFSMIFAKHAPDSSITVDDVINHNESISFRGSAWDRFQRKYDFLAKEMLRSRWAFLAVLGAIENISSIKRRSSDHGENRADSAVEVFLDKCNIALRSRLFSVADKHRNAALCEVILEERHRTVQRSMDIDKRHQVLVENIILKWMYAIPIAIDRVTIMNIPEIHNILSVDSKPSKSDESNFFAKNKTIKDLLLEIKKISNIGNILDIKAESSEYDLCESTTSNEIFEYLLSSAKEIPDIEKFLEIIVNKSKGSNKSIEIQEKTIDNALLALKTYRFIFETDYSPVVAQDREGSRYILHGAMRQLLGYRRGFSLDAPATRDHNSVCLSILLMDGGPMLGPLDFSSTCALYDRLIKLPPVENNRVAIRGAYALIKSTIHTQSAMRAGIVDDPKHYGESALHTHLQRLAKLRSLCVREVKYRDKKPNSPPLLYKECELWLLNELGVVRYLQGNMHDAVFSFRECMKASDRITIGGEIMSKIDPSLHSRLSINLALCLIERARFHDAESLVDKSLDHLRRLTDHRKNPEYRLLWALLQGCRAQIHLLTAQLDSARETVKKALPTIEKLGALGAQAWLHSVQASAALACDAHEEADKAISLALAAARGAHRPDLILNLELSAIDIQLSATGYNRETVLSSLSRLENLEAGAIRLGSHKSRCAAMLIRARALLTIEQMEAARETIIEAISIAQLNGMRLKRISGLTLLVALMAQRGEREPAKKLLRSVKLAANRARYVRAVADIERLQQAMEIEGGVPRWAGFVSDFGSTDRARPARR